MKSLFIALTLLLTTASIFGQNHDFTKLDSLFTILDENEQFFGSVAIAQGDKVIYDRAIGYADVETKIINNTDTKFRIGSISKTFTSTLIMKAVELGKLNLNDTIESYFPGLQNARKITVRDLLNHRSGIANFTDRSYFNWRTEPITPAALLDTIIVKGIDFEPDTEFSYSNSNYVLLTFILETVFDESYTDLLNQYIVKPLSLSNTNYGQVINTSRNEAKSYTMKSEWAERAPDHMSVPLGAGGIVSTPSDLCQFMNRLMNGKLVSPESLELMMPTKDSDYGFALHMTKFENEISVGHGGNIDAFASNLFYFEKYDISIAYSCNATNLGVRIIEEALVGEVLGQSYDLPSFESVELTSEELDQYLGTYETDELPMDLTFTKEGNTLFVQATGQSAGALTAKGNHKFIIMEIDVNIVFSPEENTMRFEQRGHGFDMVKKSVEPKKDEMAIESNTVVSGEDLDVYLGTYTSDALPIDLTISRDGDTLIGQGEGQPSFTLVSEGGHTYSNKEIGLKIVFVPSKNKMNFVQGPAKFEMVLKE